MLLQDFFDFRKSDLIQSCKMSSYYHGFLFEENNLRDITLRNYTEELQNLLEHSIHLLCGYDDKQL